MNINATLFGQAITFAIFVWFTMKYVWPPMMAAMQERQKRISDGLAAADRGARALNEAREESEKALKEAREQAQEILAAANRQANEAIESSKTQAREEGERIVATAKAEIDTEINRARETLRREVGALAVAGATQILSREIDDKAHADIIDNLASRI